MDELQEILTAQQKQIEDNQRLISQREQYFKSLHIPKISSTESKQQRKYLFIQTLLHQINDNSGLFRSKTIFPILHDFFHRKSIGNVKRNLFR